MSLQAGDKLGPYEILAPIGVGGMGEVYQARDTRLSRIVAIKQMKGQHSSRFEQEARAIAALNHPNICQIYDIGPDYLVMEYVEGRPLSGPLTVDQSVKLALEIAGALEEAHGKGILHRDLKPANILVTGKGSAKLLDFGVAKWMTKSESDATQTLEGTILGTAAYMSPEQAEGKPLDERSEVFSFGAVLYEVLSGRPAFSGGSMLETLNSVVRSEPAPLDSPLSAIVDRCLAKNPSQRFQSISELKAALAQVPIKPASPSLSIAVLPFANIGHDVENEYFSDGLTEEIINQLVQIPGLKVIARTSSFAFRGKEQDIRRIAEALGVTNILEGSVRKAGGRIRVTAQLIAASDGGHLWSQRYDRELADVFAIQDEIATAIANTLQMRLSSNLDSRQHPTESLPAYEAYLKGHYHLFKLTPESLARANQCYAQSIALDPSFALAYVGFSNYYLTLSYMGAMPASGAVPLARAEVQRALDIDPSLSEAHAMLVSCPGNT